MPAWDRDHPQDGGSGLQSPATAAQKTIHRRRHAGDGEEPGRGDTGQQSRTRRRCVFVFGCLWGEALNFFWVPTLYAAQICSRWKNIDKMDQRLLAKVVQKTHQLDIIHTNTHTRKSQTSKKQTCPLITFVRHSKRHIIALPHLRADNVPQAPSSSHVHVGDGGCARGAEEKKGRLGHLLLPIMEPARLWLAPAFPRSLFIYRRTCGFPGEWQ